MLQHCAHIACVAGIVLAAVACDRRDPYVEPEAQAGDLVTGERAEREAQVTSEMAEEAQVLDTPSARPVGPAGEARRPVQQPQQEVAERQTPQNFGPLASLPAGQVVEVPVELSEYQIDMPGTLEPGRYEFKISNVGEQFHTFAINGPGVNTKLDERVMPGETRSLVLTLQRGQYTVWCPVAQHEDEGMERELLVWPQDDTMAQATESQSPRAGQRQSSQTQQEEVSAAPEQ